MSQPIPQRVHDRLREMAVEDARALVALVPTDPTIRAIADLQGPRP